MMRLVILVFLVVGVWGQQGLQSAFSETSSLAQRRPGLLPRLKFQPRLEVSSLSEASDSSQHGLGIVPKFGFHLPSEIQGYTGVQEKSLISQQSLKYQHRLRVQTQPVYQQSRTVFNPQFHSAFFDRSYINKHVPGYPLKYEFHPSTEVQHHSSRQSAIEETGSLHEIVPGYPLKYEFNPSPEGQQQSLELQQPLNVKQKSLGVMQPLRSLQHSLKNQHQLRVPPQPIHQQSRPTFQQQPQQQIVQNQNLQQVHNQQNSQQLPYQQQHVQQQYRVQNRPLLQQQQNQHQTVARSNVEILEDNRDGPFQDGTYYFRFATGDGIQKEEGARITSPQTHQVTGSYSYVAPDGTLVSMEYIADENGYRAFPARPDRVNPLLPPERIPFPPPLHAVLNTPRPT